jgi:glyoxylase-like metal-dependent hydrolase (beta-lactamase superfamily II)
MVHVLDTHQLGRRGIIAATVIEAGEGVAVFDTGPESTYENVAGALRKLGYGPNDVRNVFLSHIHLDHAGAAWRFAELGATIHVHPRGAPHLLDPRKLVESATRIFGDDMQRLWGRIQAIAPENLRILEDQEIVHLGHLEVRAIATPGHASHHHVYHWEDKLFGGDVAGVQLGDGPPIPPFVPPELDVEAWLSSIQKMKDLDAKQLYLPHFGPARGPVAPYFDELEERVRRWADWFRDRLCEGDREEALRADFAAYEASDLQTGGATFDQVADYEAADPSSMAVTAATRYWRKAQAEAVTSVPSPRGTS